MLSLGLLALLLRACAPNVDPQTQASLLAVESGGEPYAISDSNTGRSYYPRTYLEAVALADRLIVDDARRYGPRNPGLGIGVVQIQTTNFARLGLTTSLALDPCLNLRVGSEMLAAAYREQYRVAGDIPPLKRQTLALERALEVYNSGRPYGVDAYVARVLLASQGAFVHGIVGPSAPMAPPQRTPLVATVTQRERPPRRATRRIERRVAPAQRSSDFFVDTASTQIQPAGAAAIDAPATSFR